MWAGQTPSLRDVGGQAVTARRARRAPSAIRPICGRTLFLLLLLVAVELRAQHLLRLVIPVILAHVCRRRLESGSERASASVDRSSCKARTGLREVHPELADFHGLRHTLLLDRPCLRFVPALGDHGLDQA